MLLSKNRIIGFLLILTSLSFILQPLNYRIVGYPLSIFAFFITICVIYLYKPVINKWALYIVLPAVFTLFFHLIVGQSDYKAPILIFFIIACLVGYSISLPKRYIESAWKFLFIACLIVSIIGAYRFIFGYDYPLSEHKGGIAQLANNAYYYLGIEYLPATRNSDSFYFGILYLYALSAVVAFKSKYHYLYVFILIFSILVCVFNLSRGLWIAILFATIFTINLRTFVLFSVASISLFIAIISFIPHLPSYFNLLYYAGLSIYDPSVANMDVSGYYTFSNHIRSEIYLAALHGILIHPLGVGTNVNNIYQNVYKIHTVHSEDLYLDIILLTGWVGIILITAFVFYFVRKYFLVVSNTDDRFAILNKSAGIFTIIWIIFNSGINFTILWYVIFLILCSENMIDYTLLKTYKNIYLLV